MTVAIIDIKRDFPLHSYIATTLPPF
jgi:hypothetical protein